MGALTFTDVPVTADVPAPATDVVVTGLAANGIPNVALNAYRVAAARIDTTLPSCGIDWSLLAGIGRVESNHGRFGGATLNPDGTSTPQIVGPALNGSQFAFIADTDRGQWDGDTTYDRAVGPMQFIPSTWRAYAVDADGTDAPDPLNINDAALAAAHYLCVAGGNLTTEAGQRQAVLAYNHSDSYVAQVLALAHAYAAGIPVADLPLVGDTSSPVPPVGQYGTPSGPAAPGPALGEADTTRSPDAVAVGQPATAATPPASGQQSSTGSQRSGTGPGTSGGQPTTQGSTPPATVPTKQSPAPAPTQQGKPAPTVPTVPAPVPPGTVPSPPSVPAAGYTIGADGIAVLKDGTRCVPAPLTLTLPAGCPVLPK